LLAIPSRVNALRRSLLAASLGAACVKFSWAQNRVAETQKFFLYEGPEREEKLLTGARKEGVVNIYTSLNTRDAGPITEAFEKKYGVKTSLWRASGENVVQRAVTETRGGRFAFDVLESDGPVMEKLYREKLLTPFFSPHFKDLPAGAFPAHRHYVPDRFNFFTIGYNTNLVKPDEVPNAYQDLLQPRWAGRIGLEAGDTDWFAAMVKHLGEEKGLVFFRQLAKQKPQIRTGHTLLGELLSSGEIPLVAAIYNHSIEKLVVKGAPVKWKPLDPTFGRPNAIGMTPYATHPHAALLFADFMLSRDGQTLIKERNRVPSSRAVETGLNKFPFQMIDPVITLDESEKWEALWSELFLGGQKVQKADD
jgi:iron(III) transport system substrate-binding protein